MGQADNMVIAPALQKNLAINPVKDLAPVMQVAASPFLFMSAAGSKYNNLNDVIAEAKANPGKVSYGSAGIGTFTHLVMELLQQNDGFKMVHVPYKGASPAMADVIGGHIPMAALSIGSGMPGIQGGKLRGLAVTSLKRSPALPDVPTLDELGFKGFEANGWLGILVPNGTPPAVIGQLNAALTKAMENPELRKTLLGHGHRGAHRHAAGARRAARQRHGEVAQDRRDGGHQGRVTCPVAAAPRPGGAAGFRLVRSPGFPRTLMQLDGIRVIDLSRILSGPFCSMFLADMGAEVIKIEDVDDGDPIRQQGEMRNGFSLYFASFNRNKKSLTLNLRHADGMAVLRKLIATADVVLNNYRPGVMDAMGLVARRARAPASPASSAATSPASASTAPTATARRSTSSRRR